MKKVLGLGNALVDILVKTNNDDLIQQLNLPKGSMQLIDADQAKSIASLLENVDKSMVSGGSAANTIFGIAQLGGDCGFIGKTQNDDLGNFYKKDLEDAGIVTMLKTGNADSGRAYTFISADSERTFATYLGAAVELVAEELIEDVIKQYQILHIEGYLVQNYELVETALKLAKRNRVKVSLDLASYNVVEANLEFLQRILPEYVDFVFANEEEAKAFTQKDPYEALELLGCYCRYAVVKIGKQGSMIKNGNDRFDIGVIDCSPIDTTGAGDQYAAGFLYGFSQGLDIETCGKIGALMAGKVIEIIGARLNKEKWIEVEQNLKDIVK